MFERFKAYLLYGNRFCGVELTSKNNEAIIYATILKKKKKEVDIDASFSVSSIKDVSKSLPKNQHIFLVINNEQVLTKKIESGEKDGIKLVNKAFPNIDISEFYSEIAQKNNISFVSICRKSYVDSAIAEFQNGGLYVTNFTLGNSIISNIQNYLDSSEIYTSNALISLKRHLIETMEFVEETKDELYHINGLDTRSSYILSLSAALSGILGNYYPITNFTDKKNFHISLFTQNRFFSQFFKIGLLFILGVLSVNFLFYNYYFNELKTLTESSQLNQTAKNKIIKLSESVGKTQKMTNDMLKTSHSKSSFYVDALVKSLPNSILLSEINYQPLIKAIKTDKNIELQNNVIMMSGESNNSDQYSDWIVLLENMDWIDKVQVENYSDSKTATSSFDIEITLVP